MGFPNQHLLEQTNRYDEGVHPEMGERPAISDNLNVEHFEKPWSGKPLGGTGFQIFRSLDGPAKCENPWLGS
jgi:hypothetical protein